MCGEMVSFGDCHSVMCSKVSWIWFFLMDFCNQWARIEVFDGNSLWSLYESLKKLHKYLGTWSRSYPQRRLLNDVTLMVGMFPTHGHGTLFLIFADVQHKCLPTRYRLWAFGGSYWSSGVVCFGRCAAISWPGHDGASGWWSIFSVGSASTGFCLKWHWGYSADDPIIEAGIYCCTEAFHISHGTCKLLGGLFISGTPWALSIAPGRTLTRSDFQWLCYSVLCVEHVFGIQLVWATQCSTKCCKPKGAQRRRIQWRIQTTRLCFNITSTTSWTFCKGATL